jgi:hypothetical protein
MMSAAQLMFEGGAALRFAAIEQGSPRTGSVLSEHEHSN